MLKAYALRLHRWVALAFALPLLVVIVTGLILSFEPAVSTLALQRDALSASELDAILTKADPQNKARMLVVRGFDGTVSLGGRGTMATYDFDGEKAAPSALTSLFGVARGLHEHLIFDLGWLVTLSTFAMLMLVLFGLFMGLPKMLGHTLSGWHKATSWGLLPLIILSPLTGLMLAFNISLSTPAPAPESGITLRDAVQIIGKSHDLTALIWIRGRGQGLMARINDNGTYRVFNVEKAGLVEMPAVWPRLIHEGNFAGIWSALINIVTSIAMLILLMTGFLIWFQRSRRMRKRRAG